MDVVVLAANAVAFDVVFGDVVGSFFREFRSYSNTKSERVLMPVRNTIMIIAHDVTNSSLPSLFIKYTKR